MRATIDQAGRVVIPKALRDQVGLTPGEVEIVADGAGVRVEPIATGDLEERDGFLVLRSSSAAIDDDIVRTLRDADKALADARGRRRKPRTTTKGYGASPRQGAQEA
jgi:AbrB family looped-hinge helix DNA binding protein